MKDLNYVPAESLAQSQLQVKPKSPLPLKLFLDDWPSPPRCLPDNEGSCSIEVKKWRLQMLLAVNPYGIPSLKFGEAYARMFGRKFELREFGYDDLNEMIIKMPDIFAVQEPDETTAVLFPGYSNDKILHDVRLGYNFEKPNLDVEDHFLEPLTRMQASLTKSDFEDLTFHAWVDRDEEFPNDVVLAGESFEHLLKVSSASIPGTMGLYQATVISAASPDSVFIQLQSNKEDQARIRGLSNEIKEYFRSSEHSIDAYNVPKEFLLPGFPCLVYSSKDQNWERCIIVGRSQDDNNVLVESIDFGGAYSVNVIFLYLIPRNFLDIPRQTLQVSLMGIKPADNGCHWPQKVGSRLRCFSFARYNLDVLLMEPKMRHYRVPLYTTPAQSASNSPRGSPSGSSKSNTSASSDRKVRRRRYESKMTYEAIIVDRNDTEMDIYLDEILVLETYAVQEDNRIQEVDQVKEQLRDALKAVPRPTNPFEKTITKQ